MFAAQELERASFGDEEDYNETKQEIQTVVDQVSDAIEKNLDEDLVERLERGEYPRVASGALCFWPRFAGWRSMWPYWNYNIYGLSFWPRSVSRRTGRTHDMLDQILEDFRADFEARLKKARREGRTLSEAELDDAVGSLKQDLSVIARRSQRREDRHQAEDEARDRRAG